MRETCRKLGLLPSIVIRPMIISSCQWCSVAVGAAVHTRLQASGWRLFRVFLQRFGSSGTVARSGGSGPRRAQTCGRNSCGGTESHDHKCYKKGLAGFGGNTGRDATCHRSGIRGGSPHPSSSSRLNRRAISAFAATVSEPGLCSNWTAVRRELMTIGPSLKSRSRSWHSASNSSRNDTG